MVDFKREEESLPERPSNKLADYLEALRKRHETSKEELKASIEDCKGGVKRYGRISVLSGLGSLICASLAFSQYFTIKEFDASQLPEDFNLMAHVGYIVSFTSLAWINYFGYRHGMRQISDTKKRISYLESALKEGESVLGGIIS